MTEMVLHHSNIEENVRSGFSVIAKYKSIVREETESQLSKVTFCPFEISEEVPPTIAIDGSYSPIFRSASMWLVAVRAAALTYRFSHSHSPTYEVTGCEINEGAELITISLRIAKELPAFSQELTFITAAKKSEAPKKMSAYARMFKEYELAKIMAQTRHDSLILMDGTFSIPPLKTIKQLANETLEACEENGNTLVAISKDSNTSHLGSVATDEEILRTIRKQELTYVKVPIPKKTELGPLGDVYFTKLHPNSPKWFRVDIASTTKDASEVFGALAQFARNQLCIGYPFPLVEAHMIAVELRKYPNLYDDLLFRVGQEMGLELEEIAWGRTNVDGRRMDAFHAYLDLIAKRGTAR